MTAKRKNCLNHIKTIKDIKRGNKTRCIHALEHRENVVLLVSGYILKVVGVSGDMFYFFFLNIQNKLRLFGKT